MGMLDDFRRTLVPSRRAPARDLVQTRAQVDLPGGFQDKTGFQSLIVGSDGISFSSNEADWTAVAAAYRSIVTIATNLASVPMVVIQNDQANAEHDIARLWNDSPADAPISARVVREVAFARAELRGESFTYIDRDGTADGPARSLQPIYSDVKVIVARTADDPTSGNVIGYQVRRQGTAGGWISLLPTEVLWLRYPHPTKAWGALAPWKAALYATEADGYARAWQRAEFRNGARPSSIIDLGTVTQAQYDAALAAIRTRVEGVGNAGKSIVVGSPDPQKARARVEHLSLTPAEMSYLESRAANADEIFLGMGIAPDLFKTGATYENRAAAKTGLWSEVLIAKLDVVGSEVDRQLLPSPTETTGWDLSEVDALRENQTAIIDRTSTAISADIITMNEARAALDLDPLPGDLGNLTLTAYRARVEGGEAPLARVLAEGHRSRIQVRSNGSTRRMRRAQPKDRARPQHQTRAEIITNGATHAAYLRHERIGQKAIAALAERQRKAVIRELRNRERQDVPLLPDATAPDGALNVVMSETFEGEGTLTLAGVVRAADGLFDMRFWIGETRKALEPFLEGTWGDGGSTIAAALGLSWDVFDAGVLTSMEQRLALLSTQMTDTTARALEAGIIAAGAEEGLSIDDMARRLGAVFEDLKGWRGKMIARTETVSGFNMAQHQVAAQSGVQLRKRWLATSDARTRESHRRVDGDTVPMTGVFANGLQFAGDPNGSPSETIQCRCTTLYEEI